MDKNAKIGSMYSNGVLINHSTGERIELKKPIDWKGELEMKIWGMGFNRFDWSPAKFLYDYSYKIGVRDSTEVQDEWLAELDGKIIYCNRQIGLVRNVKLPKEQSTKKQISKIGSVAVTVTAKIGNRTVTKTGTATITTDGIKFLKSLTPKFEGEKEKLPKKTIGAVVNGSVVTLYPGKKNVIEAKDGVVYVPASYCHEKHEMVVYYNDLGDKVEITGWEGIMSFVKLQDILNQNEYLDYVDSYPFVGIDYPASYRDGDVGFIKLFDMKGCKPLILKKGDIINKHIFHSAMKLIKKSADRLHEIRHPKTKMKAVI